MAKLILADHGELTLDDLYAALSQRLSNRYDVYVISNQYGSHVVVSRAAWMGIELGVRHRQNLTIFRLGYHPGSRLLAVLLFILLIPALAMIPLSRSRSRHELEAAVIEAIKDTWPEATELADAPLQVHIDWHVGRGYVVASQTSESAQLVRRFSIPWALLWTLLFFPVGFFVYLFYHIALRRRKTVLTVGADGKVKAT